MGGHLVIKYTTTGLLLLVVLVIFTYSQDFSHQKHNFIAVQQLQGLEARKDGDKLEHWLPDWYNQTDIGLLLANRVKNVMKRCKSYHGERNVWKRKASKRFASSKNLVYCHTAKAGSTFWRSLLQSSKSKEQHNANDAKMMVTTMRNPWHRLVSTYIEKIASSQGKMLKKQIQWFCGRRVNKMPSFKEFVKKCVLANWKGHVYNVHWIPTTERCDLCNGRIDFIVAVENMEIESNYVLWKAGLKNPANVFTDTRNRTIRKNEKLKFSADYQSYYKDMDVEDLQDLQRLYAFDVYVLQYPKTPFVDFNGS